MATGSDSERWGKLLTVGVALRTLPFFWYGISQKTTGATQTPAGDRRLRSRAGAGTGYGTQATASRYLEEKFFLLEPTSTTGRGSAARPRPRPGDACRSIAPMTDVSQIGRNYRHAMETSHGRSDGRSDAGYGRKFFSPRTDLDDRPRLGGKTPPSPGRRVPVDSPEDRRFSNRSKSHRRCRHAMETSHGRSDGRSDAGFGNRVRLGTVGKAPHCGSRTPDFAVFLVRDFAKDYRRDANAGRRPPLAVSCMRRHRLCDAGDRVSISRRKFFLLEPTSTTGRGSAARPRPRPGDACRSIAPRTDVSQIGRNRIAVAGTPWKLRTDVSTDVPTPALATGSDSERWGKLLTVGVALRTLPFFWYGISQKTTGATQTPAGDRRLLSRACAGTGYATQATASRYLEENFFSSNRPRRPAEARRQDPALARATRVGR